LTTKTARWKAQGLLEEMFRLMCPCGLAASGTLSMIPQTMMAYSGILLMHPAARLSPLQTTTMVFLEIFRKTPETQFSPPPLRPKEVIREPLLQTVLLCPAQGE
jgi:hypothetical protein